MNCTRVPLRLSYVGALLASIFAYGSLSSAVLAQDADLPDQIRYWASETYESGGTSQLVRLMSLKQRIRNADVSVQIDTIGAMALIFAERIRSQAALPADSRREVALYEGMDIGFMRELKQLVEKDTISPGDHARLDRISGSLQDSVTRAVQLSIIDFLPANGDAFLEVYADPAASNITPAPNYRPYAA